MTKVMSRENNKKESGFTLMELLVVIVIIGVLGAIAIPMFSAQKGRAQDGKTVSDVRNIVTATETYLADKSNTLASVSGATVEVRTSPGTYYDVLGNTTTGGYCIVAYNNLGKKFNSTSAQLTYDSTAGGLYKYNGSCQGLVSGGAVTGKTSDGSTFTGNPAGNNTGSGSTGGSGTGSNGGAGTGSGTGVGSDTVTNPIPPATYGGNTGVGSSTTVPSVSTVSYSCADGTLNGTNCDIPDRSYTAESYQKETTEYRTVWYSGTTSSWSDCAYTEMQSWAGWWVSVCRGGWVSSSYSYPSNEPYTTYSTAYRCNNGGDLNNTTCSIPAKVVTAGKTTTYSCPAGYTLAGTVCNKN